MWDLFGKALYDFHTTGTCPEYNWVRDDGWRQEESIAFYFAPLQEWKEVELHALQHVRGRVLDVGCGAGKHALEFQRRGLRVTGIDVSPGALTVCRERGVADVHEMDVFNLSFEPGSFDCATLFTNNLSLGGTQEGVIKLLSELRRVINPGGCVVLTNLEVSVSPNEMHLAYQERNRHAGRPPGQIRMRPEYNGEVGDWIYWLFVSPPDLSALAGSSGWQVRRVAGSQGPYSALLTRAN